ncbi:hypothetical protein [Micromonospora luteifusca]|uniref:hypothetical protein n=1 Tax=Micromonospora luteifusca TaxID=709860 RepID=UPI0033B5A1F7
MTALLARQVGPDVLIRVGVLLGTVGRYRRAKLPEHLPNAPSWTCTGCGSEWPCATKQSQLLAEFGGARTALAVYLGSCLVAAAQDLPTLPLTRVRNRFLGWLPRARI